jgi:hypothetical protein
MSNSSSAMQVYASYISNLSEKKTENFAPKRQ